MKSDLKEWQIALQKKLFESISNKKTSSQELAIYINAYQMRLIDALKYNYGVIEKIIGNAAFAKLARDYITHFPSSFSSIRWYGDQFPFFLRKQAIIKRFPFLIELCELAWSMTLTFDAADKPPLQISDLAKIPSASWPTLTFKIHPSLQRHYFFWNVMTLWQAIVEKNTHLPLPKKLNHPQTVVCWRKNLINQVSVFNDIDSCILDALITGANFSQLCEHLCHFMPPEEVSLYAASLLKSWINAELLTQF